MGSHIKWFAGILGVPSLVVTRFKVGSDRRLPSARDAPHIARHDQPSFIPCQAWHPQKPVVVREPVSHVVLDRQADGMAERGGRVPSAASYPLGVGLGEIGRARWMMAGDVFPDFGFRESAALALSTSGHRTYRLET